MSNDQNSTDHRRLHALRGQLKVMAEFDGIAADAQVRLVAALLAGTLVDARIAGIDRATLDKLARSGEELALSFPDGAGGDERAPLSSLFNPRAPAETLPEQPPPTATIPLPGDLLVDDLFAGLTSEATPVPDVPAAQPAAAELPAASLTPVEAAGEFGDMPSTQEVDLTELGRRHIRFEASDAVVVQLAGREELKELYLRDISKGGMFVATAEPPPIGAILTVTLQTPERKLLLPARVVHVKTSEDAQGPPGVGIAFDPLDEITRGHLEHYVGEMAMPATVIDDEASDENAAADSSATDMARRLLRGVEKNALYDALGVDPSIDATTMTDLLNELKSTFESSAGRAKPADKVRYENAGRLLARLAKILQDPKRRLAYDFQHGHERVNDRLAEVKAGTADMSVLCGVWRKVHPERAQTANALVAGALAAEKNGDYITAAANAIEATPLDPFFLPLREKAAAWAAMEEMTLAIRDAQHTHVEWMAKAKKWKQTPTAMRKLWAEAHPKKMAQAQQFGRKAVQAETIKRVDLALTCGRAALELDPFNIALAGAIEKWSQPEE